MRNSLLVALAFIGALLVVYFVAVGQRPRYEMIGEVGNGPRYRISNGRYMIAWLAQRRVDRWTGQVQDREVDYGQPSAWQTTGWNPLDSFRH
jgi:hypothetical protein